MTPCLNEETLQAYFDGELADGATTQVIKHLAECDGCAANAFEVERAIELMASAFEDELPESVPSDRLRERIAAALAGDSVSPQRVRPARRFWPQHTRCARLEVVDAFTPPACLCLPWNTRTGLRVLVWCSNRLLLSEKQWSKQRYQLQLPPQETNSKPTESRKGRPDTTRPTNRGQR